MHLVQIIVYMCIRKGGISIRIDDPKTLTRQSAAINDDQRDLIYVSITRNPAWIRHSYMYMSASMSTSTSILPALPQMSVLPKAL